MLNIATNLQPINTPNFLNNPEFWTPESTLKELLLYDAQVQWDERGQDVEKKFKDAPLLPGVILMQQGRLMGMISRQRFLEHLSSPYGLELFLKRPIKALYNFAQIELLIYPSSTAIVTAATDAVRRSPAMLLEPIIVELEPQVYRLVDVHQLLYAQGQIHLMTIKLLEKANDRLNRLATLDGLTQVANRRQFDQRLEQEWQRLTRERQPLSLILCDIDYFKAYNDTYGHLAGDDCLQKVVGAVQKAVQRPADLVARYGGEEFAVILPNTPKSGAIKVAENIRSQVQGLHIGHTGSQVSLWVTLSLGIATMIPTSEEVPARLIARADMALYQAKTQGRDRAVFHCE
ncbi:MULTISPECIES: GGDEF domain-containing protein [Planktothricoides]|uniref:Diguanylate cyclase n=2 Tax=Planktothricoides raciborskii TaxID=132608 RepID=A0AAU8JB80_9CYAN|nr:MULTISPECIES: diguanylate cyclase [Planktothricoides]MBD2547560.1 diguanylate cyclase [Planktothricoides raciborskii FACHB-1370]MBD2586037.1 diguanylate cyclase [Planktothricoides raciborskii FACHB-1261]